jgi:parallel beta-helix repeat protein
MAQYFRDFTEYSTGLDPAGWMERWHTSFSFWAVADDAGTIGGRILAHTENSTSDLARLFAWNEEEGPVWGPDVEIVTRCRADTTKDGHQLVLLARASGDENNKRGYWLSVRDFGFIDLHKWTNNTLSSFLDDQSFSYSVGEMIWLRMRLTGNRIQARGWRDVESEPSNWPIDFTDTTDNILEAGWLGFGHMSTVTNSDRAFDIIGVGTNGDPAPTERPDPGVIELEGEIESESALHGLLSVDEPGQTNSTTFAGYTVNQQPNDWTRRWVVSPGTYTVREGATGAGSSSDNRYLEISMSSGERSYLGWNDIPFEADVELLARFVVYDTTGSIFALTARANDVAQSETGYSLQLTTIGTPSGQGVRVLRYQNGLVSTKIKEPFAWNINTYYWMRFRLIDNHLQGKIWESGTVEPETWLIDIFDSDITEAGFCGVFRFTDGQADVDFFSYGTQGLEAPTLFLHHELKGEIQAESSLVGDLDVEEPGITNLEGRIEVESSLGANLRVPLEAEDREIHSRIVFLRNPEVDVTPWVTRAEVNLGNVSSVGTGASGGDGVVRQAFITLQQDNDNRFSPLDAGSSWNYDGMTFDPLLKPNREVKIYVAAVLTGESPAPADFELIFHGLVGDAIRTQGQTVEIECRDMAKRLQDRYIMEHREYGAPIEDGGVPAEQVMQQILDDEFGVGEVELFVPVLPSFALPPFAVEFGTVWDWLQNITKEFGWFLGYRYHAATESFRLTLLEPPRNKSAATADWLIDWDENLYIQDLDITDRDIRNRVAVVYRDESGERQTVTVNDFASQSEFGLRPMQIDETDTDLIKLAADALELANLALQDLAGQRATNQLSLPLLPRMDLYDGINVEDPRISSLEEFYGVESVRHTLDFAGETLQTEVIAAGRVIGAHQRWLQMQTREGSRGNPPGDVWPVRPNTVLTIAAADSNEEGRRRADIVCTGEQDHRDINRALQRVGASGRVVLLEGTFNITDSIILPSRRILEGQGQSTVIFLDAVVNDFFWMIQNEDLINGNPNITILNLSLDGNAPAHTQDEQWWHYGVYLERCEEAIIQGLNIVDITGVGIELLWSDRAKIIQNELKRCKVEGIAYLGDSNDFARSATISNNIVTDCNTDLFWIGNASTGIGAAWAENIVISSNVTSNNDQGISIVFIEESTISGNTVNRNIFPGLWVWQQSHNNVVTGNNCAYNGLSGIYIQGDDNVISNNESIGSGQYPFVPAPPGYNIEIDGNRNNVQGNTVRIGEDGDFEPIEGIYISSLSEDTFVTNNDLLDGGAGGDLLEDEGINTETRPGNRPIQPEPVPTAALVYQTDFFNVPEGEMFVDWWGLRLWDHHVRTWLVTEAGSRALRVEINAFSNHRTVGPLIPRMARNIEIYAEGRSTTTGSGALYIAGRVTGGVDGRLSQVGLDTSGGDLRLISSAFSTGFGTIDSAAAGFTANTWFSMRLRINGDWAWGKIWETGTAEPGWMVDGSVGVLLAPGQIACGRLDNAGEAFYRVFNFGIAGEEAPIS